MLDVMSLPPCDESGNNSKKFSNFFITEILSDPPVNKNCSKIENYQKNNEQKFQDPSRPGFVCCMLDEKSRKSSSKDEFIPENFKSFDINSIQNWLFWYRQHFQIRRSPLAGTFGIISLFLFVDECLKTYYFYYFHLIVKFNSFPYFRWFALKRSPWLFTRLPWTPWNE